jgi:CRP-like cAMP-binding protein
MADALQQHIARFITITDEEYAAMRPYFTALTAAKKQNLLTEGKICTYNYFVVKGCLRLFFLNEKGVEQTIQFAIENWWMTDYASFSTQKPSGFFMQAVEKAELVAIDLASQEKLLAQFPKMERYFRLVLQRAHAAAQFRMKILYELSKEAQYKQFVSLFPEFIQRIPQYLLASYLGFTPEYLSELRSRKLS